MSPILDQLSDQDGANMLIKLLGHWITLVENVHRERGSICGYLQLACHRALDLPGLIAARPFCGVCINQVGKI